MINKRSGKYRSEQILLLRNATGPVLQGFYYEIDFKLINFNIGLVYIKIFLIHFR